MDRTVVNRIMEENDKSTNFENLRSVIRNIALSQSHEFAAKEKSALANKRKFDISKLVQKLISLTIFDGFDKAVIDREVQGLEVAVKDISDSGILVKDKGTSELVPVPYEVIRLMFTPDNEKFSQYFFHDLMDYYYHQLSENMKIAPSATILSREKFDQQVKILLPIVKLETAVALINNNDTGSKRLLETISANIANFFNYPRLNQEDIFAIVNRGLSSRNYKLLSYELIPLDQCNGYMGNYFKLNIVAEVENIEKHFRLFAKFLMAKLEAFKEMIDLGPSKKEEFFYMTYLPLLEKHGLQSLLDFSPKFYFSRLNDVLVLDDMVSLGFTAFTPNTKLELDGLMCGMKQIAKFHSCSIILEEQLSQEEGKRITLGELYGEFVNDILFNVENKSLKDNLEKSVKLIHYLVTKFPDLTKQLNREEFTKKIDAGWNACSQKARSSKKFKNTLVHADMYVANMLFKLDENKTCVDAMLVDFQLLRYCPPVADILFFLYQNSFKEIRDKYFKRFLNEYYSELSRHLQNFKLDISEIYPKKEFEESVKYMKSVALFQAMYYSPFNSLKPDLRAELFTNPEKEEMYVQSDRRALVDLGFEDDEYRKIMRGLVEELIELYENDLL